MPLANNERILPTLIRELAELAPRFCVAGEARNEISTQYLSVVQFHLYNFAHVNAIDGKDVAFADRDASFRGKADIIVTGDKEMLGLKEYRGVKIISLREFLGV